MAVLITGLTTLGIGPDSGANITHFVLFGLNVPEVVSLHGSGVVRPSSWGIDPAARRGLRPALTNRDIDPVNGGLRPSTRGRSLR